MISPSTVLKRLTMGLACLAAPMSAPEAWAQGGGFGPDPYRPYNNQYDPFIYPVAPGNGEVFPNEAALDRGSRANRFQDYLRGVGGVNSAYRSRRQIDPKSFDLYQYRPNRKVDQESGFYEKQDAVSEAYFAYLRERDPKKRAQLLRQYQRIQRQPSQEFSTTSARRGVKSRAETEDAGTGSERRSTVPPPPRSGGTGTTRSRPAPPSRVRSTAPTSATGGEAARAKGSTTTKPSSNLKPSEILEESLRRDREMRALIPGSAGRTTPSTNQPPGATTPAPTPR